MYAEANLRLISLIRDFARQLLGPLIISNKKELANWKKIYGGWFLSSGPQKVYWSYPKKTLRVSYVTGNMM